MTPIDVVILSVAEQVAKLSGGPAGRRFTGEEIPAGMESATGDPWGVVERHATAVCVPATAGPS
jgi:hypothetical protein